MKKKQDFCVVCATERELALETKSVEYKVKGEAISVELPLTICAECGTEEIEESFGKDPTVCAYEIYRERNNLLSPQQIKDLREKYGLSQKSFALLIGMSESTVNRYESGSVQDAAQDSAMRAFEDPKFALGALKRRGASLSERQRTKVEEAISRLSEIEGEDKKSEQPSCTTEERPGGIVKQLLKTPSPVGAPNFALGGV